MNRQTAELLINAVKKIDAAVEEICSIVEPLSEDAQKKKIKTTVFNIVIDAHDGITREIAREYPDLHPDRAEIDAERQARKSQT
jgi:hypothetical protein